MKEKSARGSLDGLVKNAASFADKGRQVEPGDLMAFGIAISSRYSKCDEIVDMLNFAHEAAKRAVAHHIKSVFYDSKACICTFTFGEGMKEGSEVERELLLAAKLTINQFEWFGIVYHKDGENWP